ncbi:MAG TPA: Gfo/Idh/MocA family oxidoreductase [Magnetospirillaceae bacterium]|nr:Gfo/Idh/MocA family oxidoreductase [Magnetospirillaceae bacterium]
MQIGVGLVGVGKIAATQHVPAIESDPHFVLAATADPRGGDFVSLDEMLAGCGDIDAVILCTPPQGRQTLARTALKAGKHVMLEKPPTATLEELEELASLARKAGVTLFTAWHSRHAAAVPAARDWLRARDVAEIRVTWKEDVRVWHPGQEWIWRPGGLGVFDAGINALSILTAILPEEFAFTAGELCFPENREAPIAASLSYRTISAAPVTAEFDWSGSGSEIWDISVRTRDGEELRLFQGGARLEIGGVPAPVEAQEEYPALYAEFARLIAAHQSGVDGRPLQHVTDAFAKARRLIAAPFYDNQDR